MGGPDVEPTIGRALGPATGGNRELAPSWGREAPRSSPTVTRNLPRFARGVVAGLLLLFLQRLGRLDEGARRRAAGYHLVNILLPAGHSGRGQ